MWLQHADCKRLASETWKKDVYGCPMFIHTQKLKAVKLALKIWNKEVFGDVHNLVKVAQMDLDVSEDLFIKEKRLNVTFRKCELLKRSFGGIRLESNGLLMVIKTVLYFVISPSLDKPQERWICLKMVNCFWIISRTLKTMY